MLAEERFHAMGTTGLLSVVGPAGLAEYGLRRIAALEALWTRFHPTSDLSRIRIADGVPVQVASETLRLLELARAAWSATQGRFDPTVLDAMVALGYDRTFAEVSASTGCPLPPPRPTVGLGGMRLDFENKTAQLPPGVGVDAGGLGKGFAADIVVGELIARGAQGALVDIGGDVRCQGQGPADGCWIVDVAHAFGDKPVLHLAFSDAGIATSSCLRRRWGPEGSRHHIVDPSNSLPATSRLAAATAIATDASWAEAMATAVIVAGRVDVAEGASVIAFDYDGHIVATPDLEALLP